MLTGCECRHVFVETSCTATCTTSGTKTYTCTKCGETKTDNIGPLGHSYRVADGHCIRCDAFEYNISCAKRTPFTVSYSWKSSGEHITQSRITDVKFLTYNNTLYVSISGYKSYDQWGDYGTCQVKFRLNLKDSNGLIIKTFVAQISDNLVVNQKFSDNGSLKWEICSTSILSNTESYTVEIVDTVQS